MPAAAKILSIAPYLLVDDVKASANWYRDMLGFKHDRLWGEPPVFAMARRDGITIMLKQPEVKGKIRPNYRVHEDACWDAYIKVDDSNALYSEFKGKGVKIAREIENTEYGCRDFEIEDCNGYRLCFGMQLETKKN